jgi:hypothetical protein
MGEERPDRRIHDERAWIGVESRCELDQPRDHRDRDDCLHRESDLLGTREGEPECSRSSSDEQREVLGDGNDDTVHGRRP